MIPTNFCVNSSQCFYFFFLFFFSLSFPLIPTLLPFFSIFFHQNKQRAWGRQIASSPSSFIPQLTQDTSPSSHLDTIFSSSFFLIPEPPPFSFVRFQPQLGLKMSQALFSGRCSPSTSVTLFCSLEFKSPKMLISLLPLLLLFSSRFASIFLTPAPLSAVTPISPKSFSHVNYRGHDQNPQNPATPFITKTASSCTRTALSTFWAHIYIYIIWQPLKRIRDHPIKKVGIQR